MMLIGEFRRGGDLAVALDVVQGNVAQVTAVTAVLAPARRSAGGFELIPGGVTVALTVVSRAAAGDIPAGWTLSLTGTATAALAAGVYGIDVRLALGSAVVITETTALVRLTTGAVA